MPIRRPLTAVIAAGAVACATEPDLGREPLTELPRELTTAERSLIDADNAFAMSLFKAVDADEDPSQNVFISPLSVSMALGMTLNGAGGETFDAMAATLGFDGLAIDDINHGYRDLIDLLLDLDSSVEFDLANSIWHRQGFPVEQAFLDVNQTFFDAQVQALDFGSPGAANAIDQWVNDNTNGRITSIAPRPIPPELVMFLINAVYFKGNWTYEFDRDRTTDRAFTLADGTQKSVPTMTHGEEVPVRVAFDDLANVIELPYGGAAFTMVGVIPASDMSLEEVIDGMDQARWESWIAALDSTDKTVYLPKFEFEYDIRLNDVLIALGMDIAFDEFRADFSKINPTAQLYIDRVQHKTFVKVDEVGTEAAAVTSVGVGVTSAPIPFAFDRPFLFVLRERLSGAILFVGKIVDPTL